MDTIYEKIEKAVKAAHIKHIKYENGYPKDHIVLDFDPIEDEEEDSMQPLIEALKVITETLDKHADFEDDIEVTFYHLPGEEEWGIAIGDGR